MSLRVILIVLAVITAASLGFFFSYNLSGRTFSPMSSMENSTVVKTSLPSTPSQVLGEADYAKIYILVDNYENKEELKTAWGLSLLLETPESSILFDAGPSPEILAENARAIGVNLSSIDFVVISHEHGDHVGGISALANRNLTVYIPSHSSPTLSHHLKSMNFKVIPVKKTEEIADGVIIIGEMYGPPWEEALAVNVRGVGLIILVGCSHPGVDKLVEKTVKELGIRPYAVIGGFHLGGVSEVRVREVIENLLSLGTKKIYPIHCSGSLIRRILREEYSENYGDGHIGLILSFKED